MRHRKKIHKLGRIASHRKATLKNLATALITHHKIRTTLAKAKAARSHVERLITYGKKDSVHNRRLAFKFLQNRTLVKKLFDEIAPVFAERKGGYTRIVKLGQREGDGASLAILQLVGFEENVIEEKPKKKVRAKTEKSKTKKAEPAKNDQAKAADKPAKKAAAKAKPKAEKAAEPQKEKKSAKKSAKAEAQSAEAKPKKAAKKAPAKKAKPAEDKSADKGGE